MNDEMTFLKAVEPFNILPEEILEGVVESLQEIRYQKEQVVYQQDHTELKGIDIIIEGQYDCFFYDSDHNKRLTEHYTRGYIYGGSSVLLNKKKSIRTVIAKKHTRVYFLPREDFKTLCQAYDDFFKFFTHQFGRKMLNDEYAHFARKNSTYEENFLYSDQLYSRRLETLEPRDIVSCDQNTPVFEAAQNMKAHKVSCLFIRDEQGQIIGYVTDIILRNKVIAAKTDVNQAIAGVMMQPAHAIDDAAFIYEAILKMFQLQIDFLLVKKDDQYIGFQSKNRLLTDQAQSPFVFIQSVRLSHTVFELREKWNRVPEIVYQLLTRGVKSEIVNQMITTIADTILEKVIEEVIEEKGTPPAGFMFMVLGSEGRKEQTLLTDQDNAIIYEDKANEQRERVRRYFLDFAELVSDRLNLIGFHYCKGGYMASNPAWTHSLSHWKSSYKAWIAESNVENAMKIAAFFDCRYAYGDYELMKDLKSYFENILTAEPGRFFYNQAANVLQHEMPLTFFNHFKTRNKNHHKVINLKHTMTPIVDGVRLFALKNNIFRTNTGERLQELYQNGIFSEQEHNEIYHAYYYLMGLRLRKQAESIINDKAEPDNYIEPHRLTHVEQITLKEIFKEINDFKQKVKMEFRHEIFG